jgi:hypothetical protein
MQSNSGLTTRKGVECSTVPGATLPEAYLNLGHQRKMNPHENHRIRNSRQFSGLIRFCY